MLAAATIVVARPVVGKKLQNIVYAGNQFDATAGTGLFSPTAPGGVIIKRLTFTRPGVTESITLTWEVLDNTGAVVTTLYNSTVFASEDQAILLNMPLSATESIGLTTAAATEQMAAAVIYTGADDKW
jgi:hypothetical protein